MLRLSPRLLPALAIELIEDEASFAGHVRAEQGLDGLVMGIVNLLEKA